MLPHGHHALTASDAENGNSRADANNTEPEHDDATRSRSHGQYLTFHISVAVCDATARTRPRAEGEGGRRPIEQDDTRSKAYGPSYCLAGHT